MDGIIDAGVASLKIEGRLNRRNTSLQSPAAIVKHWTQHGIAVTAAAPPMARKLPANMPWK